jgi:MFS family permease
MSTAVPAADPLRGYPAAPARRVAAELPLLACWLNVLAAAAAMAATIPGRVYGLGLITEPLLKDFEISRTTYGEINLWATLVTAVLAVGFGTLVERGGIRRTYLVVMLALAGATALLTIVSGVWPLFLVITLGRALGQGILALVSTAMVGKSFPRRVAVVMAIYSILVAALYAAGVGFVKISVGTGTGEWHWTWQQAWLALAAIMAFGLTPLGFFMIREPTASQDPAPPPAGTAPELTLRQAVRTPVFILFGLSCLVVGTANAGIALFNESLLRDHGFSRDVFFDSLTVGIVAAAAFKLLGGWLCDRWSMGRMAALTMLLYAGTSGALPFLETANQVYAWSIAKSLALSVHTVIYFAIWGYAFGRRDLAQIQGAAHVLTVLASGVGPLLFGLCRDKLGSYDPCLYATAAGALAIGLALWVVPVPCAERPREPTQTP